LGVPLDEVFVIRLARVKPPEFVPHLPVAFSVHEDVGLHGVSRVGFIAQDLNVDFVVVGLRSIGRSLQRRKESTDYQLHANHSFHAK